MRMVSTVSEPRRAECALPVVSQMYESHVIGVTTAVAMEGYLHTYPF